MPELLYTYAFYVETNDHKGDPESINHCYYIYQFDNHVALPGQYTFPFRVLIPSNCPSSMKFRGAISSKGDIKYFIEATLMPHQSQKVQPMVHRLPLLISQNMYDLQHDITESVEVKIKKFIWFFGKGTARLSAKLD